jgi:cell wall-associated NlpC family hydrolase
MLNHSYFLASAAGNPADSRRASRQGRRSLRVVVTLLAAAVAVSVVLPVTCAAADPRAGVWSALRQCESGNNYAENSGNNHYGAYQFDLPTWRSVGGIGYPNLAAATEQDARALMLYRMRGWQPWQCASILGLRDDSDAGFGQIADITIAAASRAPDPGAVAPATVPAFPGLHYFHFGDYSPVLKQFQDQMHARGFFAVGTGNYGPDTRAMVLRLQGVNGLIPNGEIGPNTWRLAWTGAYPSAADPATPSLTAIDSVASVDSTDSTIAALQALPAPSAQASIAINYALAQLGKPYVFDAAGPDSFDCSGLTMMAYAAAGITIPHFAASQYLLGSHVTVPYLEPGDLVFFYTPIDHVAMYLGDGLVIEAPESGQDVKLVTLASFGDDYVGATRLQPSSAPTS